MARLDLAAEKLNAFLLVIAIGLAALDFTCFWILQIHNTVPPVTRVTANPPAPSKPSLPANHASTAAKSSRPEGASAGY